MKVSGLEAHWPHRLEACATGAEISTSGTALQNGLRKGPGMEDLKVRLRLTRADVAGGYI